MATCPRIVGVILVAGVFALPGCIGGRIPVQPSLAADPAVKWVFRTGSEISLVWWMYPVLSAEWVSSAALADSQVVVLCNLNAASEELMACRLYVLDANDGRVLKVIQGPARAYRPFGVEVAPITDRYAYFAHAGQDDWPAIDFNAGRVCWHPPPPGAGALDAARRLPWSYNKAQSSHDPWERTYEEVYDLPGGRQVTISARVFGTAEFRLRPVGAGRPQENGHLCRLRHRHVGGMEDFLLIADNDKYFIFSWGSYVICLDAKGLNASLRE